MKKATLVLWMFLICISATAQEVYRSSGNRKIAKPEKPKGFDASRLVYGGGVGLAFGNYTYLSLQPRVGYRIADRLAAGVTTGYTYMNIKDYYGVQRPYRASIFTPGAWIWYTPVDFLFLNTEYLHNIASIRQYRYSAGVSAPIVEKYNVVETIPVWWLGGGYRQPIGNNVSFYIGLYYNLLNNSGNPDNGIDIRTGLMLGI